MHARATRATIAIGCAYCTTYTVNLDFLATTCNMQSCCSSHALSRISGKLPDITPDEITTVLFSQQNEGKTSEVKLIKVSKCRSEHIPKIYARKDFFKLSERGPRQFLDVALNDRAFRTIVMPLYEPLTELLKKNPDSIITMVEQLIDCKCPVQLCIQV